MSYLYEYKGKKYPRYLKEWSAGKYIFPIAQQYCHGAGLDVGGDVEHGCILPGARVVNTTIRDEYGAYILPPGKWDFIFSSHTLEHLKYTLSVLKHWHNRLRPGGILFLYLPHPDMEYWLPENCKKHLHSFEPADIACMLEEIGFIDVIHSERDLYWSYAVVGRKKERRLK